MTSATFEFDESHSLPVCDPPHGKIRGVLHPDLDGGTYEIYFSVDGNTCAEALDVPAPGGVDVPVLADHDCGTGVKHIKVKIDRKGDPAPSESMPEAKCLT